VVQLEKKAPGLGLDRGSSPGSGITQTIRRRRSPLQALRLAEPYTEADQHHSKLTAENLHDDVVQPSVAG
jgi:hypothetical protein